MSLYKPLTSRDVQQDPSWQFAPFLVSTNREKVQISHLQSIQFAHNQRTHIIRWPNKYSNWKGAPEEESERMAAARDPAFFQYFVPNAPAFITTNLNTSLGLANGTQITIRSLIPSSKEQEDFITHHQHVQPYGTVITLQEPPYAIGITINPRISSTRSLRKRLSTVEQKLQSHSIGITAEGLPIIPIFPDSSGMQSLYAKPFRTGTKDFSIP
mgnify:CR=1 FL=1